MPPKGGAKVNLRHPLAKLFIGGFTPGFGGAARLWRGPASGYNIGASGGPTSGPTTGQFPNDFTTVAQPFSDYVGRFGPGHKWPATSTQIMRTPNVDIFGGYNPIGFVGRVNWDTTPSVANFCRKDQQFSPLVQNAATTCQWTWWFATLNGQGHTYNGTFAQGDEVDFGCILSLGTGGKDYCTINDGTTNEGTAGFVNVQLPTNPHSGDGLILGQSGGNSELAKGLQYYGLFFNKALTREDYESLRLDPYALFTNDQIVIRTPPTAPKATGTGAAAAVANPLFIAVGAAAGTGAANAIPVVPLRAVVSWVEIDYAPAALTGSAGIAAGAGAAAAVGASTAASVASATGTGAAAAVGNANFAGVGNAAGTGAAAAVGKSLFNGVGNATGTGAAAGISVSGTIAAAAGTGAAAAVGASLFNGVGSSTGTGAATGVGAGTSASVGSATGTGAAAGVGRATTNAVGAATGTGAAAGVSAATAASVGSTTGTGTAAAVGSAIFAGVGNAAGTSTANGANSQANIGQASGTGAAAAVGRSTAASAGAATGTGTATGVGAALANSVGAAAGTSTAAATGIGAGIGVATAGSITAAIGRSTIIFAGVGNAPGVGIALGVGHQIGTSTRREITTGGTRFGAGPARPPQVSSERRPAEQSGGWRD